MALIKLTRVNGKPLDLDPNEIETIKVGKTNPFFLDYLWPAGKSSKPCTIIETKAGKVHKVKETTEEITAKIQSQKS